MKKSIIIFFLLTFTLLAKSGTYNADIFGGLNFNGEVDGPNVSLTEQNIGFNLGVEVHKNILNYKNSNLELGIGTKFDSSYGTTEFDIPTLPVYVSAKSNKKISNNKNLYIQGAFGVLAYWIPNNKPTSDFSDIILDSSDIIYSTSSGVEGGLYYSVGIGFEKGNFTTSLNYNVNNIEVSKEVYAKNSTIGTYNLQEIDEYDYSKLSLDFGYKFK